MDERRFPFLNRVVISGIVARKLALRTNKSGVATLKLSLTVSIPTLSDDMTRKQVSTIRMSVFIVGQLAVSCESLLASGSEIIVEGRLSSPPAHGSVSRIEVHAERIQLIDSNGAVQFLARDFLEQGAEKDAIQETSIDTKRDAEKAVPTEPTPVRRRRPASERAEPSSPLASTAPKVESERRPTRVRRKRVASSAESAPAERPKTRRRRSPDRLPAQKESAADEQTVEKIAAPERQRQSTSRRKSTNPRKQMSRPRRAVKDAEKAKDTKVSPKKANASKASSDSPFELVETKDTFDPFLLEE